jgi:hypothetical protein
MASGFRDITLGVGRNSPGNTLKSLGEALSGIWSGIAWRCIFSR